MTKIEIIEETVVYYKANPRSITKSNSCVYFNEENGAMCAFSRCCTEESVKQLHDFCEGNGVSGIDHFNNFLKEEYKGHERNFWVDIQILHDSGSYWDGNELTSLGIEEVAKLKNKYI